MFESPHKCALKNDKYLERINSKSPNNKVFMRIEIHDGAFFKGSNTLKFDETDIVVPNNLEMYLANCYGDISKDPPEELQIPHHYVLMFSNTRSYKDYCYKKGRVLLKL